MYFYLRTGNDTLVFRTLNKSSGLCVEEKILSLSSGSWKYLGNIGRLHRLHTDHCTGSSTSDFTICIEGRQTFKYMFCSLLFNTCNSPATGEIMTVNFKSLSSPFFDCFFSCICDINRMCEALAADSLQKRWINIRLTKAKNRKCVHSVASQSLSSKLSWDNVDMA